MTVGAVECRSILPDIESDVGTAAHGKPRVTVIMGSSVVDLLPVHVRLKLQLGARQYRPIAAIPVAAGAE